MARRGFTGAMLRAYGIQYHTATVVGSEQPTPRMRRIWLTAPTLFAEIDIEPTAWLRIWFPAEDGSDKEFQRGYTIAEVQSETGDFAVDFVLHEPAGPASAWAQRAQDGETIEVASFGSRGFAIPEDLPAGYLLIGDSASIPAINSILRALPPQVSVEVYLEQHHDDDLLIPLAAHPLARVHWVPRTSEQAMAAALEARDWSNWYCWAGPESKALKHIRARVKDDFGFPKTEFYQQAYWAIGRAMGKERDGSEHEDVETAATPETTAAPERAATTQAAAPVTAAIVESSVAPADRPAVAATEPARGNWRSQAGGKIFAELKPKFYIAGVLQVLLTLLQLAPYVLLVELARQLLKGSENSTLWALGGWAVGLLALGAVLEAVMQLWLHTVDARFSRDLRGRLLSKLARLPLGWFTTRTSGQINKLVTNDTLALHYLVTHAVTDAVAAVVAPIAVLVYLIWVDWRLGLLLLVPILAYIITMMTMMATSGPKTMQSQRWAERMNGEATSYMDGQPVIRVFGGSAASPFRRSLDDYIGFLDGWQRPFVGKKATMDLITRPVTFLWLILLAGTALVAGGGLEPVDLLPFLFLGTTFGSRLLGIGYGMMGLRDGRVAAQNIQAALDEHELDVRTGGTRYEAHDGHVEFDGVTFGYRTEAPVVENISLTLEPGTVTALVGPSGAGKSTLAALLARFHDLQAGAIRVGGRDITTFTQDELYARIGFVFQDTQLVHGTVRENIALAVPDASDEAVEQAARDAQLHERILRLPQGYDTVLGAGATLSGGERQRLTIARALLADTPVLILDEATAFADPESEYLVQQAINRLTAGRTVLVIAHRLRTIADADRIVVLEGGRVTQSGTHSALLDVEGRYRQLWEATTESVATAGVGADSKENI